MDRIEYRAILKFLTICTVVFNLNNITNAFDNYTPVEGTYIRILFL